MRIGVDLGGTKIEAVALDDGGRECFRKRVPTPRGEYEGTVDAIAALVKEAGEGTVGIGIPGAMTGEVVKNANSNWLIGRPFKRDLERALGRPVRIENDANCFALSEAVDKMVASPQWQETLKARGWLDMYKPHEEFATFLKADQVAIETTLKDLGLVQ